jgi:two-component system NtrC family response regulator
MKQLSPEFIQALQAYSWPGNIRELVNTLEQVVIISADKRTLFARDLPNHIRIQAQRRTAQDKKGL